MTARADLLIVGGGPAGLATAIAARRHQLAVTVLDRGRPPIDKACGEGLMPDALACLHRLGVRVPAARQRPFHGIRYLEGAIVAEGRFPAGPGAGIRRTDLHAAMVERARSAGVALRWGTRVDGVEGTGGRVAAVQTAAGRFAAPWVVAADGLRSPLRRWAGLGGREQPPAARRFGVRRHFACAPWSDCVEVYWADEREAYVTPVAAEEVGVAILWRGRKARFEDHLAAFPHLVERLRGAPAISRDRGWGPLRQRVRGVVRGNLALVGDAAGYLDAITGEGLAVAFHQATALAAAVAAGDLGRYRRAWRRINALPDRMTALVLWLERRPRLRRRVWRALAAEPAAFSRFLAVHCRAAPARSLGWNGAPQILWRLVQPAA